MKILVVDDNAGIRRMLITLLDQLADEIYELNDGDKVLDFYHDHNPDWVVMDVKMKNMDGITATHELLKKYPGAKVIIVTNYSTDDFREGAKKAGALEFIDKENLFSVNKIISEYSG